MWTLWTLWTFGKKNPTALRWDFLIYPQQNLFVGRGILRSPFWRRLCFGRVVRLLQRAEESCEGLKHGYYDLPCVYFLIFLFHDIKNKIRQVGFLKKNKIKQNFTKLFLVVEKKIILRIELARWIILLFKITARRALSGYSCITRVRVCDGNAMNVRWACDDFELRCKGSTNFWIIWG